MHLHARQNCSSCKIEPLQCIPGVSKACNCLQGVPADASTGGRVGRQVRWQEGAGIWGRVVECGYRFDSHSRQIGPGAPAACASLHGHRRGGGHACYEQHALQVNPGSVFQLSITCSPGHPTFSRITNFSDGIGVDQPQDVNRVYLWGRDS